jgi:hypothetical protein
MARGAQNQAKQAFDQSKKTFANTQDVYGGAKSNSGDLYSQLFPALKGEAMSPQGYAPLDKAAMNTASQQSIGGATAGAVGEGDLVGARTRNAGSFAPAADEAVRSGERQLSDNALNVDGQNANLKEAQRQAGLGGLGSMYGTNTSAMLSALGLGNQSTEAGTGATNALTNAGNSGLFQNMLGMLNALKPSGSVGGGNPASFGVGG